MDIVKKYFSINKYIVSLIYLLTCLASCEPAFSQKAKCVIGNIASYSGIHSPYCGCERIQFVITGLEASKVYNMVIPTNYTSWTGQCYEAAEYVYSDATGTIVWEFNTNPLATYLNPIKVNRWILAPGTYKFLVIDAAKSSNKDITSCEFKILN